MPAEPRPVGDDPFCAFPRIAEALDRLAAGATWALTGVSALLLDPDGRLVIEITKPKHWRTDTQGRPLIGLGAIGGSLESGETALGCLRREIQEEVGGSAEILSAGGDAPSHDAILVHEQRTIVVQPLRNRSISRREPGVGRSGAEHGSAPSPSRGPEFVPRPALFTVSANLYRRQELDAQVLTIATYWARLCEPPRVGDVHGLLKLPLDRIGTLLAEHNLPLREALGIDGLRLETRSPLPPDALLQPAWTIRSLQLALRAGYAFEAPDGGG